MTLIDSLLQRKEFSEQPPVLVDVGASETLHAQWKSLARYSVCLAFDADQREFGFVADDSGAFKKLYVYKSILSDTASDACRFYLTRSPFCSSTLEPKSKELAPWSFARKFDVVDVITLRSNTLPNVLREVGLSYIDWFKTDSQGTDLRLFKSLGDAVIRRVIAADFEPGIIDSYSGEDKLHELLRFMDGEPFWMSQMTVKGSQRISPEILSDLSSSEKTRKLLHFSLRTSPGWAEVSYLNTFSGESSKRDHLLGWIIATIQRQHGHAFAVAQQGAAAFSDKVFIELQKSSVRFIRRNMWKLKFLPAVREKLQKMLA